MADQRQITCTYCGLHFTWVDDEWRITVMVNTSDAFTQCPVCETPLEGEHIREGKMSTQEEELEEMKARYEELGKSLLERYSHAVEVLVPVIKVMRPYYLRRRYCGFFEKVGDQDE